MTATKRVFRIAQSQKSLLPFQSQAPVAAKTGGGKSEAEIKEEEELELALALSQSEAEESEKRRKKRENSPIFGSAAGKETTNNPAIDQVGGISFYYENVRV